MSLKEQFDALRVGCAAILAALGASALSAQAADGAAQLPDVECLQLMRKARIAELVSRPAEEAEWLRRARRECNEPIPALVALLTLHQRGGLPDDEAADARRALVVALDAPQGTPLGVLAHIATANDAEESVLQAALGLVERRLASGETVERDRLLRLSALLNERLGRSEKVLDDLRALRALTPDDDVIAHALVRTLERAERWSESADALGEMVEAGGSPYVRSRLARTLARAGRLDEAQGQLGILEQEWGEGGAGVRLDLAGAFLDAAWNLRDAGRAAEAEDLFRRAAKFAPPDSAAAEQAGAALVHFHGTKEQRAALRADRERRFEQEQDGQTLLLEGARSMTAGDNDRAIELFERAAEELGDLEAVWYNLGMAAYRAERWEKAAAALDRAAALNAERVENVFFGGLALVALERWEEAVARLERALELDPAQSLAHYNLWVCFQNLGRDAEAAAHLEAYRAATQ